ncbi:hypothetical protein CGMCC3_g17619 [Colletotrichum fructicola]|nr:uncharacterized protein CGMCC3_g17619 [Colletotrichum fructicola]KAE9566217.1 hypothetical protein CGMCC3_g17619 [Colletotrichum fructicola]
MDALAFDDAVENQVSQLDAATFSNTSICSISDELNRRGRMMHRRGSSRKAQTTECLNHGDSSSSHFAE